VSRLLETSRDVLNHLCSEAYDRIANPWQKKIIFFDFKDSICSLIQLKKSVHIDTCAQQGWTRVGSTRGSGRVEISEMHYANFAVFMMFLIEIVMKSAISAHWPNYSKSF